MLQYPRGRWLDKSLKTRFDPVLAKDRKDIPRQGKPIAVLCSFRHCLCDCCETEPVVFVVDRASPLTQPFDHSLDLPIASIRKVAPQPRARVDPIVLHQYSLCTGRHFFVRGPTYLFDAKACRFIRDKFAQSRFALDEAGRTKPFNISI
jgi:hypothetical protein